MLGIETVIILVVAIFFSLILYLGGIIPWWLSVIGGFFSFTFLIVLGLDWIGNSFIPEAGWGFILWGVFNLILSIILFFMGLRPQKGRFDD